MTKEELKDKAEALYPINGDDLPVFRVIRRLEQKAYIRGYEDASKIACDVYADLLSAQGYNPIVVNKEIVRMKKAIEEGGGK